MITREHRRADRSSDVRRSTRSIAAVARHLPRAITDVEERTGDAAENRDEPRDPRAGSNRAPATNPARERQRAPATWAGSRAKVASTGGPSRAVRSEYQAWRSLLAY